MNVSRNTLAAGTSSTQGATYSFCNPKCRERFAADPAQVLCSAPERVAGREATRQRSPTARAMPEVADTACKSMSRACHSTDGSARCTRRSSKQSPGAARCAAWRSSPRTATAEQDNPELRDMSRRFWIALALSAPLLCWSHGRHAARSRRCSQCCRDVLVAGSSSRWPRRFACGRACRSSSAPLRR